MLPKFPQPGTYCRYYDLTAKLYRYLRLMEMDAPLKYPYRFPSLSPGSKLSDTVNFDELNPSDSKKHRYCAFLGVKPGIKLYIWHPYDMKVMQFDEHIEDISEDNVANIEYDESPYDAPQKCLWIEHDRYPGVLPKNVSTKTLCPEIIFLVANYVVKDITADEIGKLERGELPLLPISFGGVI